jgi:hypothetical protein
VGEEIVGWIFCCILIAALLPLGAMLYLDILEVKNMRAAAETRGGER